MLNIKALKKFGLTHDVFMGDIEKASDVYLNADSRFAVEFLVQTAKTGGMVALIGDSGSGKTTIRRYALDRMQEEGQKVKIIQPKSIDKARLSTGSICDAIILDTSSESPKRSLEAKARQIERILTNSSRAGFSHVLMIEEAHDLTIPTLKYLKRFWELEDGFKKLLSIILIGQIELNSKLDESKNYEAREIIRRMEKLHLEPFDNWQDIANYLDIKFSRLGKKRADIITDEACKALSDRLRRQTRAGEVYSVAFPIIINKWTRDAMNSAYELKVDKVDADIVRAL